MAQDGKLITIPHSYVTPLDKSVRIANYPESQGGVTPIQVVTLNRPEKLNAFNTEMINDLETLFSTADVDDRVKVIILTGSGRAFSAGIDLKMDTRKGRDVPVKDLRDPGGALAISMFNCSKPVIVAYNGLAVGIGLTSTLAAAIRCV